MSNQRIKLIAVLNAVFWGILLVQIPLLWSVPLPEPAADHVSEFAQRYRVTASLELFAFIAASVALSVLMWLRPKAWTAITLACLGAAFFWRMHVSGLSVLFRPPVGDGSLLGALHGWWQFNGHWLTLARLPLLISCIVAWLIIYARLSRKPIPNSA